MKKYCHALVLLFVCYPIFGQQLYIGFASTEQNAEVTFNDGHVENGQVYGFIDRRFIYVDISNPFKTLERKLNLTDKVFVFRNESGEKRQIKADEVTHVRIKYADGYIDYGRMKSKTVNIKGAIVDLKREVWLPFYVKDRINILGYNLVDEHGNYAGTFPYLNREGEDFVINPIDFNRINLFNFWKIDEKAEVAMLETFRDCPETVQFIKVYFEKGRKEGLKPFKKEKKQRFKEIKALPKGERKQATHDFYEEYMYRPYVTALEHYNKACPD